MVIPKTYRCPHPDPWLPLAGETPRCQRQGTATRLTEPPPNSITWQGLFVDMWHHKMAPNMGKFMGKNGEIYWKIIGKNIGKIMGKSSDKSWEIWDLAGKYGEIVGI
jgi:hypothetical protein